MVRKVAFADRFWRRKARQKRQATFVEYGGTAGMKSMNGCWFFLKKIHAAYIHKKIDASFTGVRASAGALDGTGETWLDVKNAGCDHHDAHWPKCCCLRPAIDCTSRQSSTSRSMHLFICVYACMHACNVCIYAGICVCFYLKEEFDKQVHAFICGYACVICMCMCICTYTYTQHNTYISMQFSGESIMMRRTTVIITYPHICMYACMHVCIAAGIVSL
jgi:hypothetical protein